MTHPTSAVRIAVALTAIVCSAVLAQDARTKNGAALSVTTLNMDKQRSAERILAEWRSHPAIWNSDIILLQEVAQFPGDRPGLAETLAKEMDRYVVMSAPGASKRDTDGLAILSRFPLTDFETKHLQHNGMVFHTRSRMMIAATVQSPSGPVRVYDVHLDSRINAGARLKQLAPVISDAAQCDGPSLIGGDFNTNYLRWAGNVLPIGVSFQARTIGKAMAENGYTTPLTRTGSTSHFLGLHLDWFYTRDIRVLDTAMEPVKFSDHYAVRMTVAPEVRLSQTKASR